jgi:pimeloyl-ACP methyl ester carboxylesterase
LTEIKAPKLERLETTVEDHAARAICTAMKKALLILGAVIGSIIVLPLANLAAWALIPPLSPHKLAKTGHFVSVDGIDTYYERYGSGPPLILIPAGGSHTSTWRFNTGPLSRSHEVWTLDLPGSGYSEKPATFPYTHRSYAVFVRDFMTKMGIAKAAVAGHSLGGAVALEFSLDFPERTTGLILIASGGYPRQDMPGALNLLVHRPFDPPVQRAINAIVMSFGSYPSSKAFIHSSITILFRLLATPNWSRRTAISTAPPTPGMRCTGCSAGPNSISRSPR